ncbi:MAG TPA: ATP-grasp domain-containing protein [Candidatus Binatia bacterium]|nr:ATP-grasp domain-containing protein [Candidatus Binatia bacterium]
MARLLLLLPTRTYRTEAFVEAAHKLGVDLVCASEEPSTLEALAPDSLLTLDFADLEGSVRRVAAWSRDRPLDAVVGVDDLTAAAAAAIAERLGLKTSRAAAVAAARNKLELRRHLAAAGLPVPRFRRLALDEDPRRTAAEVRYPCVLKPLALSASRGVIRADTPEQFLAAFHRIGALLRRPDVPAHGDAARALLVEDYIPGIEVALEGLLVRGTLEVLALFDKPDPLEGPYFEETIYVTPSRLPGTHQAAVAEATERAAHALGLEEGPVHAELRLNEQGVWVIELAARSIGGLCSRTLRFGTGMTLEELILRHALGWELPSLAREGRAAGVMMIPVPRAGRLVAVRGQAEAAAVPGIEEIVITAHIGQAVEPLPEGWQYLGFIFARGEGPEAAEAALRRAFGHLAFDIVRSEPEAR